MNTFNFKYDFLYFLYIYFLYFKKTSGFGNKCPNRLAYKKLMRMNMPLDDDKKVNFTTTLFALIRENLSIKMREAEEMDTADDELRETIRMIWPLQARKMMDLLVPRIEMLNKNNLTVGKIFGGLLILESWRSTRFGKRKSRFGVSNLVVIHFLYFVHSFFLKK